MSADVFCWPNDCRAAVSVTFDDARPTQLDAGLPILDEFDVKGTFYVVSQRCQERSDDWGRAAANGHELGNHSLRHSCSGNFLWEGRNVLENYTLEQMDEELAEASRQLEALLGVKTKTFAYPCGQTFVGRGVDRRSSVPVVARQFLAGRGFRDEYLNAPTFVDLAKVGGTEMDRMTWEQIYAHISRAKERGQWVVLVGHDVRDEGHQGTHCEVLRKICSYCSEPTNGTWIDTVANVAQHIQDSRA